MLRLGKTVLSHAHVKSIFPPPVPHPPPPTPHSELTSMCTTAQQKSFPIIACVHVAEMQQAFFSFVNYNCNG